MLCTFNLLPVSKGYYHETEPKFQYNVHSRTIRSSHGGFLWENGTLLKKTLLKLPLNEFRKIFQNRFLTEHAWMTGFFSRINWHSWMLFRRLKMVFNKFFFKLLWHFSLLFFVIFPFYIPENTRKPISWCFQCFYVLKWKYCLEMG